MMKGNDDDVSEAGLTADSTLNELFEFFDISEGGVRVAPMTIREDPADTRLMIIIRGELHTSSVIMAELVTRINELSDLEQQAEAARDDKSRIITA